MAIRKVPTHQYGYFKKIDRHIKRGEIHPDRRWIAFSIFFRNLSDAREHVSSTMNIPLTSEYVQDVSYTPHKFKKYNSKVNTSLPLPFEETTEQVMVAPKKVKRISPKLKHNSPDIVFTITVSNKKLHEDISITSSDFSRIEEQVNQYIKTGKF